MTNEEKAKSLYFHYCNETSCNGYDECVNCPNAKINEGLIQMAEWKEKQLIDKACKWLEENFMNECGYLATGKAIISFNTKPAIDAFRKAMKE